MGEVSWILFTGASLAVILAPGQDMLLVMSRGLGQGARAGVATAAGVSTGLLGHTVLAALGLGALLAASEAAYAALKYVGAGYLFYLGVRLLLSGGGLNAARLSGAPLSRLFAQGALSNLSNPKIVLFYFSFLPQFVPATASDPSLLLLALGVLFAALTFMVKGPVGYFAGALSAWFGAHPMALAWMFRSSGAVLIGLGLRLAFAGRS